MEREFHRLKSLQFLEAEPSHYSPRVLISALPVTVFRIERTRRPTGARWWTVYDGEETFSAPHLFRPLLPQEGERDIIGILGVRLPRRPPSLSFHFLQGSRVIDTLSTISRLRCRGWPTYRLDSRPTINHRLRGWKRRPRGHGSVNLHSRTTLFPRLIMNPIIERRNNAFRYRVDSFAPSIFSIFVAIFFIII